jgi:hypothetical protein
MVFRLKTASLFGMTSTENQPPVRALGHDVVRQDVVVANVGNDRDDVVIVGIAISLVAIAFAKDLEHLVDHELVELGDLSRRAWVVLIVVVTRRVSRPDDKVNLIPKLFSNPFYRLVDQCYGAVAIADLSAVDACRALPMVTGSVFGGGRIYFVETIGMEVWGMLAWAYCNKRFVWSSCTHPSCVRTGHAVGAVSSIVPRHCVHLVQHPRPIEALGLLEEPMIAGPDQRPPEGKLIDSFWMRPSGCFSVAFT